MSVPVTEPTQALRDWLRTHADVVAALPTDANGTRAVYAGGLPQSPTLPAVVLSRVGGPVDDLGVDAGLYQFEVWAATASAAASVASTFTTLLLEITSTTIDDGLTVESATPQSTVYLPDPDTPNTERYVVTAQVVTKARTS